METDLTGPQAKFLAALRSGEFAQGRLRLRSNDAYCCLGVACEVYRRETGEGEWLGTDEDEFFFHDGRERDAVGLTGRVAWWLGLRSRNPLLIYRGHREINASALNDAYLWDFARIADAFEAHFLEINTNPADVT